VIRLQTMPQTTCILQELLPTLALDIAVHTDDGDLDTIDVYVPPKQSLQDTADELRAAVVAWDELLPEAEIKLETTHIDREDWAESWKRFFHPRRVSRRITIKPSWCELPPELDAACVIEIDPGMSFGTGLHGTTLACLKFLDRLAPHMPEAGLLDVGCGSGILSIAAAKLGFAPVAALDCDGDAVTCTDENLARNGCDDVQTQTADINTFAPDRTWDVVVANMLSQILVPAVDRLTAAADADHGRLIISGILDDEYRRTLAVFTDAGWVEDQNLLINEWRSGLLRRAPSPPCPAP
jgi:ribosomal protein L11 methyltransferase